MHCRNPIIALFVVTAVGLLTACGDDETNDGIVAPSGTQETSESIVDPVLAPTSTPSNPSTTTSSNSDPVPAEPILDYTSPGGFTTRQFAFQNPPIALLTRDGDLIRPSNSSSGYPGPLLPQHRIQSVSPAGIDALLTAAAAAGLFADIEYSSDDGLFIADAATSALTINVDGSTYRHEAYALGIGSGPGGEVTESTPERQALLDFLTALRNDPASLVGAENLGSSADYEPDAYQLVATPIEDLSGFDPPPSVQPWPAGTSVDLTTATECVEVERQAIGDLFADATQLTFFEQDGEIYRVTPRPAYPGRTC